MRANLSRRVSSRPGRNVVRMRSTAARAKLISRSDIPAFIPRDDLMNQLTRWAELEVQNDGVTNFGVACSVDLHERKDVRWGFTVHMEREGEVVSSIKMMLDEETVKRHEFVGRAESGMPEPMGEVTEVEGAHFEMWKTDDATVDEALRESIRSLCSGVAQALNRYYAFGNVFSEDL